MKVLIVNQYAPPDASPTARLLGELRTGLQERGHTVDAVAETSEYRGHHGKGGSRAVREFRALWKMFIKTLLAPRADVVIAFSSPPCLLVVAALAAMIRRQPLVHWAMDLYPELAISLGEVAPGRVTQALGRAMRWAYRRCALVVALDEDMALHLARTYGIAAEVLAPWPASILAATPTAAPSGTSNSPGAERANLQWTWLYSGNLGRAHEWKVLLDVQAELERRQLPIQLLFEGGGASWPAAQAYARELSLRQCHWTGYVREDGSFSTVAASRLIVATQRPEAQGLLWPSKLARIIVMPKPLLWIGPTEGAIAESLKHRESTACFAATDVEVISDWIDNLWHSGVSDSLDPADDETTREKWRSSLAESCQQWARWIEQVPQHK